MSTTVMSCKDVGFLHDAAKYLEQPSPLMKIADAVGAPFQTIAERVMPEKILAISNDVLRKIMDVAAGTIATSSGPEGDFEEAYANSTWTDRLYKLATMVTGGASGLFGLPGLTIELPVTTGIMFRSIASIAKDFGEDISDPAVRLECLSVFSHGGPSPDDDDMGSSYLTSRIALAKLIQDAARFMASSTAKELSEAIARGTAPVLINYIARIAIRFNIVVSEKFLAQSIPLVSVATGAAINLAFTDHFNTVAQFHFGVRKLERHYGQELVQDTYLCEAKRLGIKSRKTASLLPG